MKKITKFLSVLLLLAATVHAQSYKWITGGGSTVGMSPTMNNEMVDAMCTDNNRNVYIMSPVGDNHISTDTLMLGDAPNCCFNVTHTLAASYDCSGHVRWAKVIDGSLYSTITGMVYSNGSVYLSGSLIGGSQHIGTDTSFNLPHLISYVLRIDTSGQFRWIRFSGADVVNNDNLTGVGFNHFAKNIAVDGKGNIHHYDRAGSGAILNASTIAINGVYDLAYDTSGNLLSAVRLSLDSAALPYISACAINPVSGTMYATVYLTDTSSLFGPLQLVQSNSIMAFDKTGNMLWDDTCHFPNTFSSLSYDGNNNLYTTAIGTYFWPFITNYGSMHDTIYHDSLYAVSQYNGLVNIDTLGNLKHDFHISIDQGGALDQVAVLAGGKLALTGTMYYGARYGDDSLKNLTTCQEPWMAIFDTTGHLTTWGFDTASATGFYNWGTAVATNNAGDVYIGGLLTYDLRVPGLPTLYTTGGNTDFFIKKYGYDCNCTVTPAATFTFTGTTAVSFTYTGTEPFDSLHWDFGDGSTASIVAPTHTYTTPGTHHVCVTVYSACGENTSCQDVIVTTGINTTNGNDGVLVYPNPTASSITIAHAAKGTSAKLFNTLGQQMFSTIIINGSATVSLKNIPAGTYLLQLTDENGVRNETVVQKQ